MRPRFLSAFLLLVVLWPMSAAAGPPVPDEVRVARNQFLYDAVTAANFQKIVNDQMVKLQHQIDTLTALTRTLKQDLVAALGQNAQDQARIAALTRQRDTALADLASFQGQFVTTAARCDPLVDSLVKAKEASFNDILAQPGGLRAIQLLNAGDVHGAEDILYGKLAADARSVAVVLEDRVSVDDSIRNFKRAVDTGHATARDWAALFALYTRRGDAAEARAAAQRAYDLAQTDYEKISYLLYLISSSQPEDALRKVAVALDLANRLPDGQALYARMQIYKDRAQLYSGLGQTEANLQKADADFAEAVRLADVAIKANPTTELKAWKLGILTMYGEEIHDYPRGAEARHARLLETNALAREVYGENASDTNWAGLAYSYTLLGRYNLDQARYGEAIDDFTKSLSVYSQLQQRDGAVGLWDLNAGYLNALLASVYFLQKNYSQAIAVMKTSVRIGEALTARRPGNSGYENQVAAHLALEAQYEYTAGLLDDAIRSAQASEAISQRQLKNGAYDTYTEDNLLVARLWLTSAHAPGYTWSKLRDLMRDMKRRGVLNADEEHNLEIVTDNASHE